MAKKTTTSKKGSAAPAKKKIAILGGGPAGLSAAFHLTEKPGWEAEYEITVYQLGWRLGGKGATGRDPDNHWRIEEHGIHVFANMYSNTFQMMGLVLPEVDWQPDEPKGLRSLPTAFSPTNFQMMTDLYEGRWTRNKAWLPNNPDQPWNPPWEPDGADLVMEVLGLVYGILTGKESPFATTGESPTRSWPERIVARVIRTLSKTSVQHLVRRIEAAANQHQAAGGGAPTKATHSWLSDLLGDMIALVEDIVPHLVDEDDTLRWVYRQAMYFLVLLKGTIDDDIFTVGVSPFEGEECRHWLQRHGLSEDVLNSAIAQAVPNICFHYPGGDTSKAPSMAASAFLMFSLRQLIAKGQAVYTFLTSTGDTVIMPLYRALSARGVKFAFFHKVTDLVPSTDGTTIEGVAVDVQVTVKGGPLNYQPITVMPDGQRVWLNRPDWEQVGEGAQMSVLGPDLESWWTGWQAVEQKVLRKGMDFDALVCAMPLGTLPYVAPKLIAQKARWKAMVDNMDTLATRQLQIWMSKSLDELGLSFPDLKDTSNRLGGPSYVQPLADFYDFTPLVAWEDWPADNTPRSLLYFCGPLDEPVVVPPFGDPTYPAIMKAKVMNEGTQFLRDISGLLPNASSNPTNPLTLDFDLLVCPDEASAGTGVQRMAQQFVKANIDPNERYNPSFPNSAQYRLRAWDAGYDNLALAGDWIWTGYNLGAFEGAVMGGKLASYALTHFPPLPAIAGYTFLHPDETGSDAPLLR